MQAGMLVNAEDVFMEAERQAMVEELRRYKISDERVLDVMGRVRRHAFIPEMQRGQGDPYGNHPCLIGHGQTISQPFIVAYMTQRLALRPGDRVLEIGTGSGYQTAVLAELGVEVYSLEVVPELAAHARSALAHEGYTQVQLRVGDGSMGWPEYAPYDAIIVTCAPNRIPPALTEQLKEGGRMLLPVGDREHQQLIFLEKHAGRLLEISDLEVRFVPMIRV